MFVIPPPVVHIAQSQDDARLKAVVDKAPAEVKDYTVKDYTRTVKKVVEALTNKRCQCTREPMPSRSYSTVGAPPQCSPQPRGKCGSNCFIAKSSDM